MLRYKDTRMQGNAKIWIHGKQEFKDTKIQGYTGKQVQETETIRYKDTMLTGFRENWDIRIQ